MFWPVFAVTVIAFVKLVDMACGELAEVLEGKRRFWPWSG